VRKKTLLVFAALPLLVIAAVHRPAARPTVFPADSRPGISVVTLNMAKETGVDRILSEFRDVPALSGADVLLLQEVKQDANQKQCAAEQLAASLGLHVTYSPAGPGITDQGLAILSRFPLRDVKVRTLKAYDLGFHSRSRFALEATADTPMGDVRIFNAHLDTRLNTEDRLAQLEAVVRDSQGFHGRTIVGGDFNSNRFYWLGHVLPIPARPQARGVDDYMTRLGFRTPLPVAATTFDYLGMHLDWVWLGGLQPGPFRIYPLEFSDHHAVWTRVGF
jgi:endonuclease/exonuclease/phosphatase family metal-dependent hydrolase